MKTENPTALVTGIVRFSYLQVWEPKTMNLDSTDKKYSVALLIPKSDKPTLMKIKAAINAAIAAGLSNKFGGKQPPNLKMPVRDGDLERPGDEVYAGHYFINATARMQPGIVDKNRNEILDQDEVYSGCYGRADINFYAFNTNGNKGIACGLNNLQKTKDGEPLGGRRNAITAFDDGAVFEDEDSADDFIPF